MRLTDKLKEVGATGYILLWLLGIPIPILLNERRVRSLASFSQLPVSVPSRFSLVEPGYGYRWYRVGGLDYLLRRTDIDQGDTDTD